MLLLGAMLVLMVLVYVIMHQAFRNQLLSASRHDVITVQKAYTSEGEAEAIEVVNQLLGKASDGEFLTLQSLTKGRLAGNLPYLAPRMGERIITLPPQALPRTKTEDRKIIGQGAYVTGNLYAFSGRDLSATADAEEDILHAFALVLLATLVISLGGGIFASHTFLIRIDRITATCDAIISGQLSTRIPERGTRDELDRLAATINAMLNRISGLMENVKQISSDIAHDLRTPLTRLRHRLEMARSEASSAKEYEEAVDRAIADSNHILSVFSALLSIGQIESRSDIARMTTIALSDLLADLVDVYRPAAEDSGHPLTGEIQPAITIIGDRQLLSQMFSNLIENAITHTPNGTSIRVCLIREEENALAIVRDWGPGIPFHERGKVFRRFYRLEAARSRAGNGLGLALVEAIAQYHSAHISTRDGAPGWEVAIRFDLASPENRAGNHESMATSEHI
jgi:signal transduction histidine kinase